MYITGQKAIQSRIQGRLGKFQGLYLLYRVNVIFIFCYTIYRLIYNTSPSKANITIKDASKRFSKLSY